MPEERVTAGLTRRQLVRRAGAGTAVLTVPALLAACGGDEGSQQQGTAADSSPNRGGRLRVGFVGGGSAEQLDPNRGAAIVEIAMATMMFDKLFELRGPKAEVTPVLAESMEPNATGDVWTLRVKQGVTWHDGKPFTIDDVIYTFQRVLDEKNALAGASVLTFLDPKGMKKLDAQTVRLSFLKPFADPLSPLTTRFLPIVQDGADDFRKPIGTGPFKYESFTAGKGGLFVANRDYHDGAPYLDDVQTIDLPDATARVNALVSGQVDAIEALPGAQVKVLEGNGKIALIESPNGGHSKLCFTVSSAPFDDVRVRQALRLLVDRPKMIENAAQGRGDIGNDLPSRFDPMFAEDIPQREYDPEQAKALLSEAGQTNLELRLDSSTAAVGMLESAQVFAETARAAGVKVQVKTNPADSYYTKIWGNAPFFQDEWGWYSLHDQLALNYASKGAYNGTKFANPRFDALLDDASRTLDEGERKDKYAEVQQLLWDEGPDVIWGSPAVLDAATKDVKGIEPSPVRPLGAFRFNKVWLG